MARSECGIHICQRKYTLDILADLGAISSAIAKNPLDQNVKLTKEEKERERIAHRLITLQKVNLFSNH